MEQIIEEIQRNYPLWVAFKSTQKRPNSAKRVLNGRKNNCTECSMDVAVAKLITTAKA